MHYVFPSEITDLETANGLPTETLIRALNMRWLIDGRATCWPAGSGSGMTLESLLGHGPLTVEWLPPIEKHERVEALDRHLSYAVARRRHLPENFVPLLEIPVPVAESRQASNRVSYRISIIAELVPKVPALRDAVGTTLSTWLTERLAELDLTVEQATEMTALQFPLTPLIPSVPVFPVFPLIPEIPVFPSAGWPAPAAPSGTDGQEAPGA